MDAEREAEIRARAEKATPGPWGVWSSMDNLLEVLSQHEHPYTPIISFYGDDGERPSQRETSDADFVANARTDIPDLLAALDAARSERDAALAAAERMADDLERFCDTLDVYSEALEAWRALTPPPATGTEGTPA